MSRTKQFIFWLMMTLCVMPTVNGQTPASSQAPASMQTGPTSTGTLAGQVKLGDKGLAGAFVAHAGATTIGGGRQPNPSTTPTANQPVPPSAAGQAVTDAEGRFQISNVQAGSFRVYRPYRNGYRRAFAFAPRGRSRQSSDRIAALPTAEQIRAIAQTVTKPMNPIRNRNQSLLSFVALSVWLSGASTPQAQRNTAPRPPDFIVLVGEGQGWNSTSVQMDDAVPASKSSFIQTLNLERLAKEGMRLSLRDSW